MASQFSPPSPLRPIVPPQESGTLQDDVREETGRFRGWSMSSPSRKTGGLFRRTPKQSPPATPRVTAPAGPAPRLLFADVDLDALALGYLPPVPDDTYVAEDGLYSQFRRGGDSTALSPTARPPTLCGWTPACLQSESCSVARLSTACARSPWVVRWLVTLWLFGTQFVFGTAPRLLTVARGQRWVDLLVNGVPRGAGQVCFMDNPWSGVLIVVGLAINTPAQYTLLGVTGLVASTVIAWMLRVRWGSIRSGLFGYNGILVGYSIPTFMYGVSSSPAATDSLWPAYVAVIVLSFFAVVLTVSLGNAMVNVTHTPPFTLPFNIVAMLYLLCAGGGRSFVVGARYPTLPTATRLDTGDSTAADGSLAQVRVWFVQVVCWACSVAVVWLLFILRACYSLAVPQYLFAWDHAGYFDDGSEVVKAILRGVSEVFLCDDPWAGVWILVGLAVCSPLSACMGAMGSTLGFLTGTFFGASKAAVMGGLWGYNSVLGCIAMGGYFFVMSPTTLAMTAACGVLCAVLQGAMVVALAPVGMPTLTFPFCFGAVLFGSVFSSLPGFEPVPLPAITVPEAHIANAKAARAAKTAAARAKFDRSLARLRLLLRAFRRIDPACTRNGLVLRLRDVQEAILRTELVFGSGGVSLGHGNSGVAAAASGGGRRGTAHSAVPPWVPDLRIEALKELEAMAITIQVRQLVRTPLPLAQSEDSKAYEPTSEMESVTLRVLPFHRLFTRRSADGGPNATIRVLELSAMQGRPNKGSKLVRSDANTTRARAYAVHPVTAATVAGSRADDASMLV